MSNRVMQFLEQAVATVVNDVASGDASDSRLKVEPENTFYPIWVAVEMIEVPENLVIRTINSVRDYSVEVPEAQLSERKVRKFWAHTNDYDGMVHGWGAAELYVVDGDRQKITAAVVEYLRQKVGSKSRVEIRMEPTPGQKYLPVLVGDSDSGKVREYESFDIF